MTAVAGSITDADIEEFTRSYARPGGWRGAVALYKSMLSEGSEIRSLARTNPLTIPVLVVGGGGGTFTEQTLRQVSTGLHTTHLFEGVGHYVALEAPAQLATAVADFVASL